MTREELIIEYKAQRDKYNRLANLNFERYQRTHDDDYMYSVDYYSEIMEEYMNKLKDLGVDPLEDFEG